MEITGTHTEPVAGHGGELPPTGRSMRFTAANIWQVADDQIVSYHVYFDTAALTGQIRAELSAKRCRAGFPADVEDEFRARFRFWTNAGALPYQESLSAGPASLG